MNLYVTRGSANARMAQVVLLETDIEGRVDVVAAQTHVADCAYYAIRPSGRVPNLGCRATWSSRCLGPENTQVAHEFDGAR